MKAIVRALIAATVFGRAVMGVAQEGGTGTTRLLVTHVRVPPAKVGMWLELQRNEVDPALKKAGIKDYTTYQTVDRRSGGVLDRAAVCVHRDGQSRSSR